MRLGIFGPPEPRWPSLGLGGSCAFCLSIALFVSLVLLFFAFTFTEHSTDWPSQLPHETAPTHNTSCCNDRPRGQGPNKATKRVVYFGYMQASFPACLNDTAGCVISSVRSPSP